MTTPRELPTVPAGDAPAAASEALRADGQPTTRAIAVLVLLRARERTTQAIANALGEPGRELERGLLADMVAAGLISSVGGYRSHRAYRLAPAGDAWLCTQSARFRQK